MEMAEKLGYACFASRGSRGAADVLCFEMHGNDIARDGLVPLVIQVGTANKAIARTLIEVAQAPRPIGSLPIVARRHKHKTSKRISWTWHTEAGKFDSLAAALEGK
jgi:hypothetical protein